MYPTGGPTAKMLTSCSQAASAMNLIVSDLYEPNFEQIYEVYRVSAGVVNYRNKPDVQLPN